MKVLLTGANGYIGRRLKRRVLEIASVDMRIFVRNKNSISANLKNIEIYEGSAFDKDSLKKALSGVECAYYLIHSLTSKDYEELDKLAAQNFLDAAIECGVKRIIYLGGLGEIDTASKHLKSRLETGQILSSKPEQIS